MSDLPFEIPTDVDGIRKLFVETRALLASQWVGLSEEQMTQRPGPHPEWSVKDIIAHICWWETFAIIRLAVLGAGLEIKSVEDYDSLNKKVDAIVVGLSLQDVFGQFSANEAQFLNLIDHFDFEEWSDETRPNFEGRAFMYLLGANTFGHYHEHIPGLKAYREKLLG